MRVGISIASAHVTESGAEAATWAIERGRAAARAGLSCLTVGDHHATGPIPYIQNVPILGRMLADWDDRPAGCLFLMPAWNPVLLAEQIGTLAAIAAGPFVVQTGLGGRDQVDAMGLGVTHRGRQLEENMVTVQALLAGEDVDGVRIAPTPPREVEWWVGGESPSALDRAARLGTCWYANADLDADGAAAARDVFLAACDRHGTEPNRMPIRKDVFISGDGDRASAFGTEALERGYRGGQPRGAVAFGDVDTVAEQLSVFGDLGFTDIIIRTMVGVPQSEAVRSIELAGEVARQLA